jgi:glycosyltransferase involved in cell wall biosynthesis
VTRVLIVEPAGGLWGSERALLDLVGAASDVELAVCCPPGSPIVAELRALGVPAVPYFIAELHRKSPWQRLVAAFGLMRACWRFRPTVIHLNQSGAYKVALPAAILFGLPIVGHVRIFEDAAYLAAQRPDPRRLRALIAISDAVETEIRSYVALAPIAVHRLYDAYRPGPSPALDRSARQGIACVGRLTPIKGQALLLEALALIEPTLCRFVGAGEPDYERRLKAMPTGSVEWLGFVNEPGPIIRASAVLACPSLREPLGRVIFEAWDAGAVPVVFAGSGGAAEIVAASGGGLAYETQTAASLAAALTRALTLDAEQASALVSRGRAWVREHCDPQRYIAALAAVWRGVETPKRGG